MIFAQIFLFPDIIPTFVWRFCKASRSLTLCIHFSIRIRIKTQTFCHYTILVHVREYLPLEQGTENEYTNKETHNGKPLSKQEDKPLCAFHCSKTTTPKNIYIAHYQLPTPHLPHLHLQLLQMTIPSKTMQRMTNSSIYIIPVGGIKVLVF